MKKETLYIMNVVKDVVGVLENANMIRMKRNDI